MDEDDTGYLEIQPLTVRRIREYAELVRVLRVGIKETIEELEMMSAAHPRCGELAEELAERLDFPERFANETVARRASDTVESTKPNVRSTQHGP